MPPTERRSEMTSTKKRAERPSRLVPSATNDRVPSATNDRVPSATNDRVASATNDRVPSATNDRVPSATNDRVASATSHRGSTLLLVWMGSLLACQGRDLQEDGPTADPTATEPSPTPGEHDITPTLPPSTPSDPTADPFIDRVISYEPPTALEPMFGYDAFPGIVLGPPEGGGTVDGGTDVLSLGCGGSIVLFFDVPVIVDGAGADFIVFENPFQTGATTFSEPAEVAVSDDGETWFTFPCSVDGTATWPPTGCAGINPVISNAANGIDPTDPAAAGGDAFDLADVGLSQARYVRLLDRTLEHYGSSLWCDGSSGGFDLDAVAVVHEEASSQTSSRTSPQISSQAARP